jgi:cobalt/nickel transport system permease protein
LSRFHRVAAGIDHLERLARGSSPIHGLHPAAKGIVTLLYITAVVSMPQSSLSALVPFVLYPALLVPLAGVPFRSLFPRLAYALPFALAAGLSNLIFMPEPLFALGALIITRGALSFAVIMLKTALSVFAVLILIATTPFADLAECLTAPRPLRALGLQMVMTYRYIGALLDEAQSMWTAYALRAPGLKALRMKDVGSFMGQLLLRSFDRADRVYAAMKCRGFAGVYHGRVYGPPSAADRIFVAASIAGLSLLRFVNLSLLLGAIAG